ncbi:MAG: nickel-dependent hydrogenase large subunit [Gallionella sp.]|nr:nickel-dependent hydrogenase large subunit [Gallionella sp.]
MSGMLVGGLTLRLRLRGGKVENVEIESARPQAAVLLAGRTPEQAVRLVPLLFSLCGGAQGVAAQAALQAAQGKTPDARQSADWAATVRREAAAEHLWHLMLAWPPLYGLDRLEREYADCRRRLQQAKSDDEHAAVLANILTSNLLDMPPGDWLHLGQWDAWRDDSSSLGARLLRGAEDVAGVHAALLPHTTAADWLVLERQIATPAYCAAPTWQGEPRETGALARQHEHPLVSPLSAVGRNIEARIAARLVELAQWACGETGDACDWVDAVRCADGSGLARVETARGVLLHRVRVEHGLIAEYAAVAPTEWNFHPQGAYAREAMLITASDNAERKARMLALSLDPCVGYEVVLEQAD